MLPGSLTIGSCQASRGISRLPTRNVALPVGSSTRTFDRRHARRQLLEFLVCRTRRLFVALAAVRSVRLAKRSRQRGVRRQAASCPKRKRARPSISFTFGLGNATSAALKCARACS